MDSFQSGPAIERGGQSFIILLVNAGALVTAGYATLVETIRLTILMALAVVLACTLIVLENHGKPRAMPRGSDARRRGALAVLK